MGYVDWPEAGGENRFEANTSFFYQVTFRKHISFIYARNDRGTTVFFFVLRNLLNVMLAAFKNTWVKRIFTKSQSQHTCSIIKKSDEIEGVYIYFLDFLHIPSCHTRYLWASNRDKALVGIAKKRKPLIEMTEVEIKFELDWKWSRRQPAWLSIASKDLQFFFRGK